MGEDEDSGAEAHDLSGGTQTDRGGAESAVDEGELGETEGRRCSAAIQNTQLTVRSIGGALQISGILASPSPAI